MEKIEVVVLPGALHRAAVHVGLEPRESVGAAVKRIFREGKIDFLKGENALLEEILGCLSLPSLARR